MSERRIDFLIVGTGPAGVSAAWPLVEAGHHVTLVDGGETTDAALPEGEYLALRRSDPAQADWMLGRVAPIDAAEAASPKFRSPTLAFVFRDHARANGIEASNFALVGSLAAGGLSNAWGCGVARFGERDWNGLPIEQRAWDEAYAAVARRIGLSGRCDDDLVEHFGIDALAEPALALDDLHATLESGYARRRRELADNGFRLGRARLAVLSASHRPGRSPCDLRGTCLWGCARGAMYSAYQELQALIHDPRVTYRPGCIVHRLHRDDDQWRAEVRERDGSVRMLDAAQVLLAAGTVATSAIAMRSMEIREVPLLHLPTAAFALWLPRRLGRSAVPGTGLAQLAFTLDGDTAGEACGFTFSTHGLPVSEFLRRAPLSRRGAIETLRLLLPSCVVANCFLPSRLMQSRIVHGRNGEVVVEGRRTDALPAYATRVRQQLARAFGKAGAIMLPGSFSEGSPGSDVHYAGTLPMRATPRPGECDSAGALAGMPGVFVVDGAALPTLPSKSHTLSIMANAHRVASGLVQRFAAR